eukprot:s1274_g19.t1
MTQPTAPAALPLVFWVDGCYKAKDMTPGREVVQWVLPMDESEKRHIVGLKHWFASEHHCTLGIRSRSWHEQLLHTMFPASKRSKLQKVSLGVCGDVTGETERVALLLETEALVDAIVMELVEQQPCAGGGVPQDGAGAPHGTLATAAAAASGAAGGRAESGDAAAEWWQRTGCGCVMAILNSAGDSPSGAPDGGARIECTVTKDVCGGWAAGAGSAPML